MAAWSKFNPFLHNKTREMLDLAQHETLTSRKMLEIEYGEFPLKGADIQHTNDRPVEIKNIFDDKGHSFWLKAFASMFALGYVSDKKKQPQDSQASDVGNKAQRHEGEYDRTIYLNRLIKTPFARLFQAMTIFHRPTYKIIGHEHVHILQLNDENKTGVDMLNKRTLDDLTNAGPANFRLAHKFNNVVSLGVMKYLRSDKEIQARLHTVIAAGYRKRWHQMPETQHQLWGALISSGLVAPKSIYDELEKSKDTGLEKFYNPRKHPVVQALSKMNGESFELNMVYFEIVDPVVKEKHWRENLPQTYGHLLELYGDPNGRSRLGILAGPAAEKPASPVAKSSGPAISTGPR